MRARRRHGHISKQGSVRARHALVEACWSDGAPARPLHAFYERIRARRGHSVAIVAAASKLACLFWCLLTREEDYAYQQPSLTKKKLRRLEITAGAKRYTPEAAGIWHANDAVRKAERELARQAEVAYARTVSDWHASPSGEGGRECDTGARIKEALKGQSCAADHKPLTSALRYVIGSRPHQQSHITGPPASQRQSAGADPTTAKTRTNRARRPQAKPQKPVSRPATKLPARSDGSDPHKQRPKQSPSPLDFHPSSGATARPVAIEKVPSPKKQSYPKPRFLVRS